MPGGITWFHNRGLASLGLPALAAAALPDGYRELRISGGHGWVLGPEYPLIRIVQTPTEVSGAVVWIKCNPCQARIAQASTTFAWRDVLERFDGLGVADFTVPRTRTWVHDAGDLFVEARTGNRYRAYEVNAPQLQPDPAFVPAKTMFGLVDSLSRLVRPY